MERSEDALQYRDTIYEQFARIGKAAASPKRLELLDLLSQGPRTVEALAKGINQSVANTSQHLQVLRSARLVEGEKDGLHVHYRLADEAVGEFYRSLRRLAESRLTEVKHFTEQFLAERELADEISRERLIEMVRAGEIIVVDLRTAAEFEQGHIPGARSIPAAELEERLAELPRDRDVAVYCRGPYCVIGIEAAALMRDAGIRVHRLEEGAPEWKALGYKLETNSDNESKK